MNIRVCRYSRSIGVSIETHRFGVVTVTKEPSENWNGENLVHIWDRPARISWSGGNGSQTQEQALEFSRALTTAARIASLFDDAADPSDLTDGLIVSQEVE